MSTITPPGPRTDRRTLPVWKRLLFSLIPLLALLLLAEAGLRIWRGDLFRFPDYRGAQLGLLRTSNRAVHHPVLGWTPRPHYRSSENNTITTADDGIRLNGGPLPAEHTVLAVGDSFTFGAEVSDHETWPAHLQELIHRPVLNAGVFGYGFDQAVLRAEELIPKYNPRLLIASLIPHDIARCEMIYRHAWKPCFRIKDGQLLLTNTPVPQTQMKSPNLLRNILGYSLLAHVCFGSVRPDWWYEDSLKVKITNEGPQVAALLVERLYNFCRERGCSLLILVQGSRPPFNKAPAEPAIRRANELGVPVLDLASVILDEVRRKPEMRDAWFTMHMTNAGNEWVASQIEQEIRRSNLLPEPGPLPAPGLR